ncbi:MAG: hypothetical protein HOQ02_04070 [Lysobacter sp.]|nr:hypothetical protein [Lysobacter sp.]
MKRSTLALAAAIATLGLLPPPTATGKTPAAPKPRDDSALVTSAMRAAPPDVARDATVIDIGADGKARTVREGHNGFTCMADNPETPGPDPMCMDANAMAWANAWMGHQPPPTGKVGLMYMLEGGTDASNTDPYAKQPNASNHWVKTGPHVMVVGADDAFYAQYPKSEDPKTGAPYVMWPGSPYQHLMVPVK